MSAHHLNGMPAFSVSLTRLLAFLLAPSLCILLPTTSGSLFTEAQAAGDLGVEEREAVELQQRWESTGLHVFELPGLDTSLEDVLQGKVASTAWVVGIRGEQAPQRRNASAGEPFLSVIAANATELKALSSNLVVEAMNRGAQLVEAALGRPLYPLKLQLTAINAAATSHAPFAVYDVSHGHVYLNERHLQNIMHAPEHATAVLERFATYLWKSLANAVGPDAGDQAAEPPSKLMATLAKMAGLALAVAFASAVPLWFCIACPIVLGLLAPLVFNAAFGVGAELLCEHYNLPSDACAELWYGAFALAGILSLASAIPIVYVCRIPECSRHLGWR